MMIRVGTLEKSHRMTDPIDSEALSLAILANPWSNWVSNGGQHFNQILLHENDLGGAWLHLETC